MERTTNETADSDTIALSKDDLKMVSYRAYQILRVCFTAILAVAGFDKFFHILVNWDQYLPPVFNRITGGRGHELMLAVGVVEMIVGLGVWFKPKVFAYIVATWLILIIVNLIIVSSYFDIVLRDLGLALGAIVLGQLSEAFSKQAVEKSKKAVMKLVIEHIARGAK